MSTSIMVIMLDRRDSTIITVSSSTDMQRTADSHHVSHYVAPPQRNTCT